MMKNISARNKGLLTGLLIIIISAIVYYYKRDFNNSILIVSYVLYGLGITWALVGFRNTAEGNNGFRSYFQQGFKCFIVVTLMMVCATWLFLKFNVPMRDEMVEFQRQQLKLNTNYTAPDIEEKLVTYRKFLLPGYTIAAILSYLGIGTLITTILSVFLSNLKKNG